MLLLTGLKSETEYRIQENVQKNFKCFKFKHRYSEKATFSIYQEEYESLFLENESLKKFGFLTNAVDLLSFKVKDLRADKLSSALLYNGLRSSRVLTQCENNELVVVVLESAVLHFNYKKDQSQQINYSPIGQSFDTSQMKQLKNKEMEILKKIDKKNHISTERNDQNVGLQLSADCLNPSGEKLGATTTQAALLIETISMLDNCFDKSKIPKKQWKHFAMEYYRQLVDLNRPFLLTKLGNPFPLEIGDVLVQTRELSLALHGFLNRCSFNRPRDEKGAQDFTIFGHLLLTLKGVNHALYRMPQHSRAARYVRRNEAKEFNDNFAKFKVLSREYNKRKRAHEKAEQNNPKPWDKSSEMMTLYNNVREVLKNRCSERDQLKEIEELKELFPVEPGTCTTLEEQENEEARQITALRWYPPGESPYLGIKGECFDALVYKGTDEVEHWNNVKAGYLADNFTKTFLDSVRYFRAINPGGDRLKKAEESWVQVPVGDSMDHAVPEHIKTDQRVRFLQKTGQTCLIQSFASACYHLGWKDSANKLSTIKHHFVDKPFEKQVKMLREQISKRVPELDGEIIEFNRENPLDIFLNVSVHPTVVIPVGTDGGTQHAVTILGWYIFDSNVPVALKLCKESLDWCTNTVGGFKHVHFAIRFKFKERRNLSKKQRKRKREFLEGKDVSKQISKFIKY